MSSRRGRAVRARLARSRGLRAVTAVGLSLAVASTGLVALAGPALADVPAPTVTGPATNPDNNPLPTWTFAPTSSPAGTDFECSVDPQGTPPAAWTTCQPTGYTPPALTVDGPYVFSVREVVPGDTALVGQSTPYVLDRVATGSAAPVANPTNQTRPSWTVTTEGTATCSVDGGVAEACSGTWQTPTDLAAGSHTLTVDLLDGLGNTGTATASVVVDLTAPADPAPVGPASPTNVGSLTWTWAAPGATTATCTLVVNGTPGTTGSCTSLTSHTVVAGGDADYALTVRLTDAAGNSSAAVTSAVTTYDGTPPPAPSLLTQPAQNPSTDKSPQWTFTTPGTTTTCVLTSTTHGTVSLGSCASGTAKGTNLADDGWTLTVTTADAAGNTATLTAPEYVVDTTGPSAPTVTRPAALGNDPRPRFTWMGELPSTAECRVVGAGGTWDDCTARYYDLDLTADGTYAVEVRLTDPLGNLGAVGTSLGYTYDSTPPAAADLSGVPTVGNDATPTYAFAVETRGSATCSVLSGVTTVDTQACTSGTYTPAALPEGTYTVQVVTRDEAGNSTTATRAYSLDLTAPGAPVVTPPASPSKLRSVSWGITGDGTPLTCTLSTVPVTGPTACTSGFLADLTGQADGTYTLVVTARDAAGNSTSTSVTHVLDTTAPASPTITGPASPGNAFSPTWTFPVQANTTAQCRLVQGMSTGTWSTCSGGSYSVSGLADGTYTVDVLVTDTAGNAAPLATSAAYTSDRTAPASPVVGGPSGPGRATAVTWTWTGEAGVSATCRLDRAGVIGSTVDCSTGSFSPTLSGDSSYVVVVQLTDAAGNASPETTTAAYLLDTGVPVTPGVTGPTGITRTPTVTWTFTGIEAGALVECNLVRNGSAGGWSTCTSGTARSLPSDGSYVLQVRQTDAAGNQSGTRSSTPLQYDGTPPATPVVTSPSSPSSVLTPSFAFTSEPATSAECRLLRSGALVRDWASCSSPATVDLTGLSDGSYVVEVRLTDTAGNVSATGAAAPYVLDTTAPDPPTVSGPAGPSTVSNPTFTWTGEAGTTSRCRYVLDGVLQGTSGFSCASPFVSSLSGDGRWALRVLLVDAAGNRSADGLSGVYVLDTTPPAAAVVTAPASPGRSTLPSWSATVEAGATTECRFTSGAAVLSDWGTCRLPVTTDLTGRPDGSYTFAVRATDAAGLTGPAGAATYVLDTTAPAAPVFTSVPASPSRSRALSFAYTAEAGTTQTCRLVLGTTVVTPDTACTSPVPVNLAGLGDGAYTFSVRATDAAGNDGAAQTATYVLDTAAPAAPVLVTGPAATAPDRTPSWVFTAETGSTLTCRVVGATSGVVQPDTTCTSPFQATLAADDAYTFSVRATDAAGNTGAALTSGYVLDSSAPATANVVAPASPSRNTSPTWQVSSSEGTVQCRLVRGSILVRDWSTCGPTFSVVLNADGQYTLSARVVDTAGNLSGEVQSRYVLDTTAPAPAALTLPPTPSTDRSPTWGIASAETGATATCAVLGPTGATLRAAAACAVSSAGSPYNLDLTGAGDGGYTLVVRVTDLAGNTGPEARATYVLDTTAPNAVLFTAPASPSSAVSPTWSLTGDSDAVLECRLTGPGITGAVFTSCPSSGVPGAGSFTAALGALADGTYTLTMRSRDAAGNLGPEVTSGYELDRVAPAAPSEPVAPPSPSQVGSITWTFALEAGSAAWCTLSSATAVVGPEQPCSSPVPTDLAQFGDGEYTLSVRAVDLAGNWSPAVTGRYVFDSTPPDAPTITASPASPSKSTTPTWVVTAAEAGGNLQCQLLGTPAPAWATCPSPVVFDLAPATDGSYTLQVRQLDDAGNTSAVTEAAPYVLDLQAPLGPLVTPPQQQTDNSLVPEFAIALQADDTETRSLVCNVVRVDGQPAEVRPCDVADPVVVDLTSPALTQAGDVVLEVQAVDALGNRSAASRATYTFDNVPPVPPTLLDLPVDHGYAPEVSWTFGATDLTDEVTFTCQLMRTGLVGPVPGTAGPCVSGTTLTLPSFGQYWLEVSTVDVAGNVSVPVRSATFSYLPPVPAVTLPRGATSGSDDTPTWTFTVPRGFTATCTLSGAGASIETDVPCSSGTYTATLTGRAAGTYTLVVTLSDGFTSGKGTRTSYRYTPVVVPNGHIGTPGTPVPPSRPEPPSTGRPSVPPPPATGPVGPATPGRPTVDPEIPRPGAGAVPRNPSKPRALSPVAVPLPAIDEVPKILGRAASDLVKKPTIPLLLLFVVVGFLLLQNRIDRRDPKLASAPVGAEPELDFGPVLTRGAVKGGALA